MRMGGVAVTSLDPEMYAMLGSARAQSSYVTQSNIERTLAGRVRDFVGIGKLNVEITLDDERPDNTYTTMDRLGGRVNITSPQTLNFDKLEIYFLGQTYTLVERLGTSMHSTRNEAHHQFLKLVQPISPSMMPEDQTLEGGQTYEIPFMFAIPEGLLMSACRHTCASQPVKDTHLRVPPTLNDPDVTPIGSRSVQDMSADMVRISYGIRVRVLQKKDDKETLLAEKHKKLRIIPALDEQPPITFDSKSEDYCLRKEKSIRKGMLKGKLGRIVMEAAQPPPIMLSPHDLFSDSRPTMMARLLLRFDPSESSLTPPKLGSLKCQIRVHTFFSTTVMRDFPNRGGLVYDPTRGIYSESVSLSSRNMSTVQWTRQEAGTGPARDLARQNSAGSIHALDWPSHSEEYSAGSPYWVAEILVPIVLPAEKFFVPTFHTCLVSRNYTLETQLSIPTPGAGARAKTLTLKLPVQIAADRVHERVHNSREANAQLMAYYEAQVRQAMEEGDDYFFNSANETEPPRDEYDPTSPYGGAIPGQQLGSPVQADPRESMMRQRFQSNATFASDGPSSEEEDTVETNLSQSRSLVSPSSPRYQDVFGSGSTRRASEMIGISSPRRSSMLGVTRRASEAPGNRDHERNVDGELPPDYSFHAVPAALGQGSSASVDTPGPTSARLGLE